MSNIWAMVVIVQAAVSPVTNSIPVEPPAKEFHLQIAPDKKAKPDIDLRVEGLPTQQIGKMVGVEADTIVNNATAYGMTFTGDQAEALCNKAMATIQKQTGILSASCVQIQ